jgi:hypothetical protein
MSILNALSDSDSAPKKEPTLDEIEFW